MVTKKNACAVDEQTCMHAASHSHTYTNQRDTECFVKSVATIAAAPTNALTVALLCAN